LRDDKDELLELITKSKQKINRPEEDIRQYFSETSKEKMKNQISHHQNMIHDALQRNDAPLVYHKLSELKTLLEIFGG